jgi:hypothetical protein
VIYSNIMYESGSICIMNIDQCVEDQFLHRALLIFSHVAVKKPELAVNQGMFSRCVKKHTITSGDYNLSKRRDVFVAGDSSFL